MQDSSYQKIIQTYREIENPEEEAKFKKLLNEDPLLRPISELKIDEVKIALAAIKNPQHKKTQRYLGLAIDIALNVAVILGPQKADPLIVIVKSLLESKANPNGKTHLGLSQVTFLEESISARQDFAMTKIFIDAGAKKTSEFSLLSVALLLRDPACALHAWHFFMSGASLWEELKLNNNRQYCIIHAAQKLIEKRDFHLYLFFKALDLFFRNQRFSHINAILFPLLPDVLIQLVCQYAGEFGINNAAIEKMMTDLSSETKKTIPKLNQKDLLFDSMINKTAIEKQQLSQALLTLSDPAQEIKVNNEFIFPLMLAVGIGDDKAVKRLLKAKAEPLIVSNSGYSCLIWALNGTDKQTAIHIIEKLMRRIDVNAPKEPMALLENIKSFF